MALFSLHHSFVGKTTQKQAYTASAHVSYITRPQAATAILGARMPLETEEAMEWLDEAEDLGRKNARVIDKLTVALPVELTHDQNVQLVNAYCERMSQGRASWIAAIHDTDAEINEKGQFNPHAHIVFHDRDFETGKRVMKTTSQGSTDRFREAWEYETNLHLRQAGQDARIDRRSLKDQGIEREAQIHVGVAAAQMFERGYTPQPDNSYLEFLDGSQTRWEANAARIARNLDRDAQQFAERTTDALLEANPILQMERLEIHPDRWTAGQSMARQQDEALDHHRKNQEALDRRFETKGLLGEIEEAKQVGDWDFVRKTYADMRTPKFDVHPEHPDAREERREADPEPEQTAKAAKGPEKEKTAARQEKEAKAQREEKVEKNWLDAYIETYRSGSNENDQEGGHEMGGGS